MNIAWPNGARFAFTVFDDPDAATLISTRTVYDFLADLEFRTTIGFWPNPNTRAVGQYPSLTGADAEYVDYLRGREELGFEIGWHGAAVHTSEREETIEGLHRYRELFGHGPRTLTNHFNSRDAIYFGPHRLSGWRRAAYNILTSGRNAGSSFGHVEGHPCFWGDVCREHFRYARNFVFQDINTLRCCPQMPYHDPQRPYVACWFASSEGADAAGFARTISEPAQDALEREGGACIMYTHFGKGFFESGELNSRFRYLMERLAARRGWFVPVSRLLDFLAERNGGPRILTPRERSHLETRWLWHKLRYGSA